MMADAAGNIFAKLPQSLSEEVFQEIIQGERFRLERISSSGQATPAGQWYDQEQHEWVLLLSGAAGLRFEGEEGLRALNPGDFVNIPRTHGIGLNGQTRSKVLFGWLCITQNLTQHDQLCKLLHIVARSSIEAFSFGAIATELHVAPSSRVVSASIQEEPSAGFLTAFANVVNVR